jgi:hypothetical protein
MSEELKKYFGDPLTGLWAILAGVLFLGLVAHYQTLDWNSYWALWVTEILSFVLLAVFFYKPSQVTGYGAVAGSVVWLLNQLNCWYHLTALQANAYLAYTQEEWGPFYYLTAALNVVILGFVYWKRDEASTEDSMTWGTIGLGIMALFSGWKLYEIYREQFPPGTPVYYSANLWGIGILAMALGSILYLRSSQEANKTYGIYAAAIGVLIAACAALYYGLALTLIGV